MAGEELDAGRGRQAMPWSGRTAAYIWRDPSGLLRAFPRIEDPVLVPVYLAFFMHYLAGWAPFGACRGCLPLCRSQLLPRSSPPETAAGMFNLGVLAISMRMRMFPSRMWRRPPQFLFLVYKFIISLFIFEISHSCIFKAVERTLFEGMPSACETVTSSSSYLDMMWLFESLCSLVETDWVLSLVECSLSATFLWYALAASRLNTLAQLEAHLLLAVTTLAAVVYRARTAPHCAALAWG